MVSVILPQARQPRQRYHACRYYACIVRRHPMPNHIRHFAIHADQVDRARSFYENVFDWGFEPWGPPNFYLIHTGPKDDRGLQGALQQRQQTLDGAGMRGFECTIGVDDLDAILALIPRFGGTVVSKPFAIDGVGRLAFFHDTEGNRVGVMQYDSAYGP
jgi:predicted enzyme related to lactoylglutathione lyase